MYQSMTALGRAMRSIGGYSSVHSVLLPTLMLHHSLGSGRDLRNVDSFYHLSLDDLLVVIEESIPIRLD